VGNAIKFTEEGGVKVQLRLVDSPATQRADGGQLTIDVIDSGIGMKPDALAKNFDPFSQADNSITRRFGGTGLGLSISKRLAEAMGGEVTVQSDYGHGSTFTVLIATGSLEDIVMVDAETLEAQRSEVAQQGETAIDLPPCKILVADDSPANRKLIHLVLERAGATVTLAENGQQALEHATQQTFDIIFMDMQMPVMDGYTATRHLRDQGYDLPIIALTADDMRGSEEKCRQAGCSGFMTKPIDMDKLIGTIAGLLGHVPSKKSAEPAAHPARGPLLLPPHSPADGTNRAEQPAENQGSLAAGDAAPLVSSLPTDDPEFAEIVVEFVDRLCEKMDEMDRAWQEGDVEDGALDEGIWRHSRTGGGHRTGPPAETLAKQGPTDRIPASLAELRRMSGRVVAN